MEVAASRAEDLTVHVSGVTVLKHRPLQQHPECTRNVIQEALHHHQDSDD